MSGADSLVLGMHSSSMQHFRLASLACTLSFGKRCNVAVQLQCVHRHHLHSALQLPERCMVLLALGMGMLSRREATWTGKSQKHFAEESGPRSTLPAGPRNGSASPAAKALGSAC